MTLGDQRICNKIFNELCMYASTYIECVRLLLDSSCDQDQRLLNDVTAEGGLSRVAFFKKGSVH